MTQEIRILSGLQAGASLTLSLGTYTLGTSEQCDIVLEDRQIKPIHAQLVIEDPDIVLNEQEGAIFTLNGQHHKGGPIALGSLFLVGNTWLVIDDNAAPWPDMNTLFADMKPSHLMLKQENHTDSEISEEPNLSALDEIDSAKQNPSSKLAAKGPFIIEEEAPSAKTPNGLFYSALHTLRKNFLKLLLTIGVISFAILCMILALTPANSNKHPQDQNLNSHQARIDKLLQEMRLKQRVNLTVDKQGNYWLRGYVAKDQDLELLINKLAQIHANVQLNVFSEESILNAVKQTLATSQFPIQATTLGMGRIRLVGAAVNYEILDTLLQKMNTSIAGLRGIDSEVLIGEQLVAKLRQMIIDAGLSNKVALVINNGEAIINGTLDAQEMTQWEQLMAQFVSVYGNILPIRASFPPTANMLPFKVVSAFSGDLPFIVTDQGQKLMVGGTLRGYTLMNITEQEILFDGPRKVQIQR